MEDTRICNVCSTEKHIDAFTKYTKRKSRYKICTKCQSLRRRQFERDDPLHAEKKRRRDKIRRTSQDYKLKKREENKRYRSKPKTIKDIKIKKIERRIKKHLFEKQIEEKPWLNRSLSRQEKVRLRYALDPYFKIAKRIKTRINRQARRRDIASDIRLAIYRSGKSPKIEKSVGYTVEECKDHLEALFSDGMNWTAFMEGKIHIDHIKPLSSFHDDEILNAWALNNLQPLWAVENLRKGAKYDK